ncbi:ComF family protein [Scatolibacter rhodanostii]|uniref:ComF family protein n=1 Tax=Scatolibacter rhodanostii TaxID=2014781 RepID=UPI000C08A06C|nr:double zinc ribbon domain-containing protein [Scatolibacter rhodanostii]
MSIWFEKFLNLLFPPKCPLCRKRVREHEFCEACRRNFPQKSIQRSLPIVKKEKKLRTVCVVPYEGAYRKAVQRFKFSNKKVYGYAMTKVMAEASADLKMKFDAICFVPISKKRKRQRGYNQSELLAALIGKSLTVPVLPLLIKVRENEIQHELPAEKRVENVKNVFAAKGTAKGLKLLLIDDILTTGATLSACTEELFRAGADEVCGLCFADTSRSKAMR